MKKYWFIILSILIVILIGVWGYMMFWHDPNTNGDGLFANLNWFSSNQSEDIPTIFPNDNQTETPVVNVTQNRLQQLTIRAVAGYQPLTVDEAEYLYFVEAGLGHIYRIDLATGQETRVTNTTIAQAYEAKFSPRGDFVAIRSDITRRNDVTLGTIQNGTFVGQSIPATVIDFAFTDDGYFLYSTLATNSTDTIIRARNLETNSETTIHTIPLRSIAIQFPNTIREAIYFYPRPSASLSSAIFTIEQNQDISRLSISGGFGLTGFSTGNTYVYSTLRTLDNQTLYATSLYNLIDSSEQQLMFSLLPEKCVADNNRLYCFIISNNTSFTNFPDEWYKGSLNITGGLWRINITGGSSQQILDVSFTAGRDIDAITPTLNTTASMLYFINKYDKTLWSVRL